VNRISPYAWVFHISFHDLKSHHFFVCFCAYYASVCFFLEDFIVLRLLENDFFLILGILTNLCQCCLGAKNLLFIYLFVIYQELVKRPLCEL